MSTSTVEAPEKKSLKGDLLGSRGELIASRSVKYKPLGSSEEIELKYESVEKFLVEPTKSGKMPTPSDIIRFMMLCKARLLNPWVGDAYLVGYDTDNVAKFNLITAVQSMLKRAELHSAFDGIVSGVIVTTANGEVIEREGNYYRTNEILEGGWARVWRKDRKVPFFASVPLRVYSTGLSRWKKDPGGMIQKVAKSGGLRDAFPNELSGMYDREEFAATIEGSAFETRSLPATKPKSLGELREQLTAKPETPSVSSTMPDDGDVAVNEFSLEIEGCNSQEIADALYHEINNDIRLSPEQRKTLLGELQAKMG